MTKPILIATDGSSSAQQAVAFGLQLARAQNTAVVFAHVAPSYEVLPAHAYGTSGVRPHELSAADGEPLERAAALAEHEGVSARGELLVGSPVDEIVTYADSIDAPMIVIGCRGHGTVAGTLLCSVSQGVLREARRPVLVVPRSTS